LMTDMDSLLLDGHWMFRRSFVAALTVHRNLANPVPNFLKINGKQMSR